MSISVAALFATSCGDGTTVPLVDLSATWSGRASQHIPGQTVETPMVLKLTQSGQTVSGTYFSNGVAPVSGTISGNTFQATANTICGAGSGIAVTLSGRVSGSTMTGTYSGTDCAGPITNGEFSVSKQTGSPANIAGGWSGDGLGSLVFQLNQNVQTVSGPFVAGFPESSGYGYSTAISGSVDATVSGDALTGTLNGGCLAVAFAAVVNGSSMTGTYGGSNTCFGVIVGVHTLTNGQFILTKGQGTLIAVLPMSTSFSGTERGVNTYPAKQTLAVMNSGDGVLSGLAVGTIGYGAGQPTGWLSASLNGATAPTTLELSATTGTLAAGTYTATVPLSSSAAGNSPQTVPVTFVVGRAAIALTPSSVIFNSTSGPQTVFVRNSGGGTLTGLALGTIEYGAGQPTDWLSATLNGTVAPDILTLSAARGTLAAGTYTATVPVTSTVASNSPQNVMVTFTVAPPVTFATVIAGAGSSSCGLTAGGVAYCWGQNFAGQLGNGTFVNSSTPVAVAGGLTFGSVAAGYRHTCGVTTGGVTYCWGDNADGELGNANVGVSGSRTPVAVAGGIMFAAVTAGSFHSCGLTAGGIAYCWGENLFGELGNGTTTGSSTPVAVTGGLKFAAVTAGFNHTCGLSPGGVAYCWGNNAFGELGNGNTTSSSTPVPVAGGLTFAAVTAGDVYTCGLTTRGIAYCWGNNPEGELGNGTTAGSLTPVAVAGGLTFAAVSAGYQHTCGLATGGIAYCWGNNADWELGNGTTTGSSTPVPVAGGLMFAAVSAGYKHTCGLATGGVAYCWGNNAFGQLGNGTMTGSSTPLKVDGQP